MSTLLNGQGPRIQDHYRRRAEAGDTDSQYNLGVVLESRGRHSAAARWYRRAAQAGDVDAMFNLAGLLQDLARMAEARHWYRRAAEAGDIDARTNLSLLEKQFQSSRNTTPTQGEPEKFSREHLSAQGPLRMPKADSYPPKGHGIARAPDTSARTVQRVGHPQHLERWPSERAYRTDSHRSNQQPSPDTAKADPKTLRPWYRQRRGRRLLTAVSLPALFGLILSACQDELTPDGSPYSVSVNGSSFTVTNTSSGGNEREALIPSKEPQEASSTSCATWDSGVPLAQNGIIFRGVTASGGWDGVVIERNIYLDGFWDFIVIYFHGGTFDTGPSVDLSGYLGTSEVWPLSICAEVINPFGPAVLSFAVAKGSDPMVPDGTPGRGATFVLNSGDMPASGQTGTYIAHVPSGTSAVVSGVTIDGNPAPSPLS